MMTSKKYIIGFLIVASIIIGSIIVFAGEESTLTPPANVQNAINAYKAARDKENIPLRAWESLSEADRNTLTNSDMTIPKLEEGLTPGNNANPEGPSNYDSRERNQSNWYFGDIVNTESLQTGSGFFADLLYSDEQESAARQKALTELHKMFNGPVPLTVDWWTNLLCSSKIPKSTDGYAFIDYKGKIETIAVVSGERQPFTQYTEFMQYNDGTEGIIPQQMYNYKFSIKVSNFDNQNRTFAFNVYADGTRLFNKSIILSDSQTFSRLGSSMIYQTSPNKYNTICIKFTGRPIQVRNGNEYKDVTEVCNTIVEVGTVATTYHIPEYIQQRDEATSSSSSGSTSSNGQNQAVNLI